MKINNYIKYLLSLILLPAINIYAQTSNLNQIISQAQQEASNLTPPLNLSSIINTPIIKYLATTLGSSFLGFAIPFLFVFGVLAFLTYEAKKEINRPLLLIYFIIDLLLTIFFPAILLLFAIILGVVLLLFGFYKLFHTLTGSTIGGITGAIIATLILYVLLTNGTNIIGFLFSSAFYILLFIFFIIIFIYGYKLSQSSDINKLKKLIYHIHKPEDVRTFENQVNMYITNFRYKARSLEQILTDIQTKLNEFNNLLNQRQSLQQLRGQIQHILNKLQQHLPQQLQGQIQNLVGRSLRKISQKKIGGIINQLRQQLRQQRQQLPRQQQQHIRQLINLLNQLRQQKQLLNQLRQLKSEIRSLLNTYNRQYKDFNDYYNSLFNFINTAINFHQNYNDPKSSVIIRFLTNKENELQSIKGNIDYKHMIVLHNPNAQNLIKKYIL